MRGEAIRSSVLLGRAGLWSDPLLSAGTASADRQPTTGSVQDRSMCCMSLDPKDETRLQGTARGGGVKEGAPRFFAITSFA